MEGCAILNLQKHGTCRQNTGRAASSKDEARLFAVESVLEDNAMTAALRHVQNSIDFIAGKRRSHKHYQDDTCIANGTSSGQ